MVVDLQVLKSSHCGQRMTTIEQKHEFVGPQWCPPSDELNGRLWLAAPSGYGRACRRALYLGSLPPLRLP